MQSQQSFLFPESSSVIKALNGEGFLSKYWNYGNHLKTLEFVMLKINTPGIVDYRENIYAWIYFIQKFNRVAFTVQVSHLKMKCWRY